MFTELDILKMDSGEWTVDTPKPVRFPMIINGTHAAFNKEFTNHQKQPAFIGKYGQSGEGQGPIIEYPEAA